MRTSYAELMSTAHRAVAKAKRDGVLRAPSHCARCRQSGMRLNAHHDDYSKPLEVTWLCTECHFARHGELGTGVDGRARCAKCGLIITRNIEYSGHTITSEIGMAHVRCRKGAA